jgi:hypothetical protein
MGTNCELLDRAIEAHGGLDRWEKVKELVIRARSGGVALPLKFKPSAFKSYEAKVVTSITKTLISDYPLSNHTGVFESNRVSIIGPDKKLVAERDNPRALIKSFRRNIFWDNLDTLYFGGYAVWNYLNLPFLLARQGFFVEEIDPWDHNGQQLSRLRTIFPDDLPTHCREQVFYFDRNGLLVRHDYTAEVFGQWAKAAHYSWEHKNFRGLIIPTRRRVFPRKASGHPLRLITLVSIDIDDVTVNH